VTGFGYTDDVIQHAFLHSDGVMTDLGTLGGIHSFGLAINTAGQVTGYAYTPGNADYHAFLYKNGVMIDLNTLIPAGSGWTLNAGHAINDNGQITGDGTINFESRAFLLTPVAHAAVVLQPIDAVGSSVFSAWKGVIPVKFALTQDGAATCQLPPATIAVARTLGGTIGPIEQSSYLMAADSGSNFRISGCQYLYNLAANSLGSGRYRVDISVNGAVVGNAEFALK
jgi:probable HAF family extracellular repeat protein